MEVISAIVISILVLCTKAYIDKRNLLVLKGSKQNISIAELMNNWKQSAAEMKEYDKLFKVDEYENAKIYYSDEIEPALKLVHAYIDKAKMDNERLFGSHIEGPITIKFDYKEEVFKKRNSTFKDYAGLYSYDKKEAFLLIEDCYSNALAINYIGVDLGEVLRHEYTHHGFYEFLDSNGISKNNIPIWFMEGVCDYIGYEGSSGYTPEKMVDFNELNTHDQWKEHNNKSNNVYEQSYVAIRQLVTMKGENVIRDILLKTKDVDFNTAFGEVVSLSFEEYEKLLKEDFKNKWAKYNKIPSNKNYNLYDDIKIECLEKYLEMKPENVSALLYLADLYKRNGSLEKAKFKLNTAVEKKPENAMAWHSLALIYMEMYDFDNAVSAFEKVVINDENPAIGYINIAHVSLLKDVNKAVASAKKAKEFDKSSNIKKQVQALESYQSYLNKGKPFEGCLQLIKSNLINFDEIKKALIQKLLKDYPSIKNSARSELEKIMNKL